MGGSDPVNISRWSSADTGGVSRPAVVSRKGPVTFAPGASSLATKWLNLNNRPGTGR